MLGIHTLIKSRLNAFERQYGYDMAYARQILDTGLKRFNVFASVFKLAAHRQDVPLGPWFAAKWVATQSEDCGPCQQLLINMALEAGLQQDVVKALAKGQLSALPPDMALTYQWAQTIVRPGHHDEADALRGQVIAKWGEPGLVSLALAMAGARSFPMIKRALGHQQSCQLLQT